MAHLETSSWWHWQRLHVKAAIMFFALAISLPWIFTIPLALAGVDPSGSTPAKILFAMAGLSPTIAAVLVLFCRLDLAERLRYWQRLRDISRLSAPWLLDALLLVPALTLLAAFLDWSRGGWGLKPEALTGLLENPIKILPFVIFFLLFGPLPEELGWRGFGLA